MGILKLLKEFLVSLLKVQYSASIAAIIIQRVDEMISQIWKTDFVVLDRGLRMSGNLYNVMAWVWITLVVIWREDN